MSDTFRKLGSRQIHRRIVAFRGVSRIGHPEGNMDKTYVKVYMRAEALLQPLLVIAFLPCLAEPVG